MYLSAFVSKKVSVKALFNLHLSRQQTTTPNAKADISSNE
jgi:hypothetical protein